MRPSLSTAITVTVGSWVFYSNCSHVKSCSAVPLRVLRFLFSLYCPVALDTPRCRVQPQKCMSPPSEKTPEAVFIPSFPCAVDCIRIQRTQLLSHRVMMAMDFFSLRCCFLWRSVVLSIAQWHTNKCYAEALHEQTSASDLSYQPKSHNLESCQHLMLPHFLTDRICQQNDYFLFGEIMNTIAVCLFTHTVNLTLSGIFDALFPTPYLSN